MSTELLLPCPDSATFRLSELLIEDFNLAVCTALADSSFLSVESACQFICSIFFPLAISL